MNPTNLFLLLKWNSNVPLGPARDIFFLKKVLTFGHKYVSIRMSKGEGTTPQTRKAINMTAQEIVNFYMVVRYGKRVEKHAIPVVEAIMRRKEAGQSFTVKEIGMELMGDKYNEKGAHSHLRCSKAQSMTGYITAALQKLKELNLITSYEVKDMEHPRTFSDNDACVYYLNGKKLPEKVELSMDDGTKIALPSRWIAGVECKWESVTRTVYPKIKYYKFK